MSSATKSYAQQYLDANPDVKAEYEQFNARDPKKWNPENYVAYHYYNYGANENRGGHEFQKHTDTLAKQILGQNISSKWSGEGHGSAEANARDMGKILSTAGITDISQFGKIPKYEEALVQTGPDGKPVYGTMVAGTRGSGENSEYVEEFQPLADQSKVTMKGDVPMFVAGETYGNKVTGQPIQNTYGERQQGNAWGGTFAGKGNTGYRVQFDAKGNPIFYTSGASSNDLANLLDDPILGKVAQAGAAYFGGPLGTAALNLAMGKDPKDVAKAAALSYAGGQAAEFLKGSDFLTDAIGQKGADIIGGAAKNTIASGGKADPIAALLSGGVNVGMDSIFGQIPGFENLDKSTQGLIRSAVGSTLKSGGLDPASLISSLYKSGAPSAASTQDQGKASPASAGTSRSAAPAAQPMMGIDPMQLLQAQMASNDAGAQIKSDYSLFGKDYFGSNSASAPSTQRDNASSSDALMAALGGSYDEQGFSSGGDVTALLHLLRS